MHACIHARTHTCTDKIVQSWSVASPTGFLKCWKLLRVTWGSGTGRVCASDCTCVSGSEYWAPDKSTSSDFLLFFPSCPFGPTLSCYDESQKVKRSQVPWCQGQIGGESRTCKACVVHTARTCSCRRLHKCVWLSKDFEKQSVVSPSHKLYHNFTKTATAQPSRRSDIYTHIWFPSFQKAFTTQKTKLLVFFYTRILRYIHILYTHPHKNLLVGPAALLLGSQGPAVWWRHFVWSQCRLQQTPEEMPISYLPCYSQEERGRERKLRKNEGGL